MTDLKFINRAGRNISGCSTDRLVADVNAVYVNTGSTAETAAKRNRGVTGLRRVEILTVLNLNAGLELGEVQEVAPIHRQIRNLGRVEDSLHLSLLGVNCDRTGLHFNDLAFLAKLQLHVRGGSVSYLNCQRLDNAAKSLGRDLHLIIPGSRGPEE